jgi:UTP--glucose-1-phosphate uridylyltransferase
MEEFFDLSAQYNTALSQKGKTEELQMLYDIAHMANVYFLRQKETSGLARAVGCARSFVGDEPFVVLYGDDVIFSEVPVCRQLMDAYERYGKSVVGVKAVAPEWIRKYCSLKVTKIEGEQSLYYCDDMIEKPSLDKVFSMYSILGRCVLTPDIFDVLESIPYGAGGELQLTDAMGEIARRDGMVGVDFDGIRYDMGNKFGIIKANIEVGLNHPEVKDELREFIKKIASEI